MGEVPVAAIVLRRLPGGGPQVALTFDDCDDPGAWEAILDALRAEEAPATFFPLGMRVERWPGLGRRTVADGHAVGSHGYDHARLPDLPPEDVRRRLLRDHDVWQEVAGITPRPHLRPPYGAHDPAVLMAAAGAGYPSVVLWDVDPEDWRLPGPQAVARRALEGIRPGSIVVLHAVQDTAAALPAIVAGIRAAGLRPVALPAA